MTTLPLSLMPSSSHLIPVIVTPLPKTTIGSAYTYIKLYLLHTMFIYKVCRPSSIAIYIYYVAIRNGPVRTA